MNTDRDKLIDEPRKYMPLLDPQDMSDEELRDWIEAVRDRRKAGCGVRGEAA